MVFLLWEKPDPTDSAAEGRVGVLVAKNRNGPRGEVTLRFRKSCVRLEDLPDGVPS